MSILENLQSNKIEDYEHMLEVLSQRLEKEV